MQCYQFKETLGACTLQQALQKQRPFLILATAQELRQEPLLSLLPQDWQKERFAKQCYAENQTACTCGRLLDRHSAKHKQETFRFFLFREGLLLADMPKTAQERLFAICRQTLSFPLLFSELLEALHEQDLDDIEKLEAQLDRLEDQVLSSNLKDFDRQLSHIRRHIRQLYRYYLHLQDLCDKLLENPLNLFTGAALSNLRLFRERIERLSADLVNLREYASQVRDAYQSQIDLREGRIMKVLTIVTVLFTPPMLIAGWYGMNFPQIPVLNWRLGYLFTALLAVLSAFICYRIIKRKGFF